MEEKNLVVVKSNHLISASYRLGLDEQRLLLACIAQIDSTSPTRARDEFTVSAKQFSSLFNIELKSAYQQIEKAAEDLFERKIVIDNKKEKIKLVSRWTPEVEYNYGEGSVTLTFSKKVLPYISSLKERFTKYKIEYVSNLTSAHAIRIYELCLQYLQIGSRTFQVDELKKILGIENEYSKFYDFKKRALTPAQNQINKHTDIKIKIKLIRKLRKITHLEFEIQSKNPTHHKSSKQKTEKILNNLLNTLN